MRRTPDLAVHVDLKPCSGSLCCVYTCEAGFKVKAVFLNITQVAFKVEQGHNF